MTGPSAPGEGDASAVRRSVARGTLSTSGAHALAIGLWLVLTPVLVSHLGRAAYGVFVIATVLAGFTVLFDLGLGGAVTKLVAEHEARHDHARAQAVVSTALLMFLGLGCLALVAVLALASPAAGLLNIPADLVGEATTAFQLGGAAAALGMVSGVPLSVLAAIGRFDLIAINNVAGSLLHATLLVTVLTRGGDVAAALAVSVATTAIMVPVAILLVHRSCRLRIVARGAERGLVRRVASFSWAIFATNASGLVTTKTDEIVIASALPVASVTPYALSRRLVEPAEAIVGQFAKVLLPLASRLDATGGVGELRALFLTGSRLVLGLGTAVYCGVVVFAAQILTAWVGPEQADGARFAVVLGAAGLAGLMLVPSAAVLQGAGRHRPIAIAAVLAAAANLILSLVLVRHWGAIGVAVATLVAVGAEALLFSIPYAMRIHRVGLRSVVTQVLLPVAVPVPVAVTVLLAIERALEPTGLVAVLAGVAAGGASYLATFLLMRPCAPERALVRDMSRAVRARGRALRDARSPTRRP